MKNLLLFTFLLSFSVGFAQDKAEIFFALNRYDLEISQRQKIDSWVEKYPKAKVLGVYGYCDHLGTLEYNDSLSVKRAKSVEDYLRSREVAFAENYSLKGYGESFVQSKIREKNRKVEIVYAIPEAPKKPDGQLQKKIETAKIGDKVRLPGLNFYNMSDVVVPNSRPVLDKLLAILNDNPNLKVEIQGHICCQTDKEKDYSYVSTQRAKAVYDFLVKNGVKSNRLSYKGFGVSSPLRPIPEKNEKEQDENRRVEVEIIGN
ncbi:OmpA family protein [Flavobacterium sp.]|uniref:OmpA family protein n=1 Tax=Flavobacterium sp. TaxID=239 RepID=UPI00120B0BF8|nr:OmpA family protein [Flavobacterium sp.]RZJ69789.1 MAG: OmpA family protein [Flavobacterium sp.]